MDLISLKQDYFRLKESERNFREIIDMLPETVFEIDLNGNVLFVNEEGLAKFGLDSDDYKAGINVKSLFLQNEMAKMETNIKRLLSGELNQSTEYMAVKKDGTVFPVLIHSRPIKKEDNSVTIRGVLIDLTENYKIRKQLEREKDFVNSLLDTANSLVICLDTNENIIMFNKECEKLTGYKLEEVKGKHWPETFIPKESHRKSELPFSEWIKIHPEDRYDAPLLTKSGEVKIILWSNTVFSPHGSDETIALAIGHDVTDQMAAIEALRESEKHYRAVWDNLPVGICLTDRDGIYRYVNPAYCRIYGFKKDELIGKIPDGLILPAADPEERRKYYNARFDNHKITPLTEHKLYKHDGTPVWVEVSSDFINENGKPKFLITINVDVTIKKLMESALKETEHRYDLLFQNVRESVALLNKNCVFEMINNSAAAFMGGKPSDFIGKSIQDLFPPEVAERQIRNTLEVIKKSKSIFLLQNYDLPGHSKKWFKVSIYPVVNGSGFTSHALLVANDVSDEIRQEAILNARFKLLDKLRNVNSIDDCLALACNAIYDAGFYKRAVLTFHNEDRVITNLGQVGLDRNLVESAKSAKAPSKQLTKSIMRKKFKISNSYFIPIEAGLNYQSTKRYIPPDLKNHGVSISWKEGDELFVPVLSSGEKIEGWLSVDTPFDGHRPTFETVRLLEEITNIVAHRAREILYQQGLIAQKKETEDKHITLREILDHMHERHTDRDQKIEDQIERLVLPLLKRLSTNTTERDKSVIKTITTTLNELTSVAPGWARLYQVLTKREIQICEFIRDDHSSKEIASNLNISVPTVNKYREHIRRKLNLTSKKINLASYLKELRRDNNPQ